MKIQSVHDDEIMKVGLYRSNTNEFVNFDKIYEFFLYEIGF